MPSCFWLEVFPGSMPFSWLLTHWLYCASPCHESDILKNGLFVYSICSSGNCAEYCPFIQVATSPMFIDADSKFGFLAFTAFMAPSMRLMAAFAFSSVVFGYALARLFFTVLSNSSARPESGAFFASSFASGSSIFWTCHWNHSCSLPLNASDFGTDTTWNMNICAPRYFFIIFILLLISSSGMFGFSTSELRRPSCTICIAASCFAAASFASFPGSERDFALSMNAC